jgi:hypothetical protein
MIISWIGSWAESATLLTLYAASAVLLMTCAVVGTLLGRFINRNVPEADRKPLGSGVTGAVLGLLAFMLAFTFGTAANRFAERKQLVVEESNAIGTAYLRAQLVEDPYGGAIRTQLRHYVDSRLEAVSASSSRDEQRLAQFLIDANATHARIWSQVVELSKQHPDSVLVGLLASAVNSVIDLHATRVAVGLHNRIPTSIWVTIYFIAIVATALTGYDSGLSSRRSTLASLSTLAMVMTFCAVVLLIIDLDRPAQTMFSVDQQTMIDLQRSFSEPGP